MHSKGISKTVFNDILSMHIMHITNLPVFGLLFGNMVFHELFPQNVHASDKVLRFTPTYNHLLDN